MIDLPKSRIRAARTLGLALAAVGLGLATPAGAQTAFPQEGAERVSVTIGYADLNTGDPAGVAALLGRIKSAAAFACGGRPDVRQIDQQTAFHQCVDTAIRQAVAQANLPQLTAIADPGPRRPHVAG
ncbi:UrcA family protein [Phenylobacterium montanum]|uniref:UrcA family protein n=1 Tax=Phenylobacterium montanum TaxID=2823693 RepID=A0A975IU92_9CAUL|nr:UrcA family protein [Caulobacter sp. S6]QUD87558.1 UrcA family protein [Caulobacter sp. S6]